MRLRLVAAERVHHVGDRLVVAMIGPADRVMMGRDDQPRPKSMKVKIMPFGWR